MTDSEERAGSEVTSANPPTPPHRQDRVALSEATSRLVRVFLTFGPNADIIMCHKNKGFSKLLPRRRLSKTLVAV